MKKEGKKSPLVVPALLPKLGVAVIARNSGKTIRECIKSFEQYVDQIVVVLAGKSADNTESEARRASKKVEIYHFEWVNDFAAARNFSFSKLKTEWVMWVDSDDIVENADKIAGLLENTPPNITGIWLPYFYAFDEYGNCVTLFDRERILRASAGWVWAGRVHETVQPLSPVQFAKNETVRLIHRHTAGEDRSVRNFGLLELMHKENPDDKRVWMYIGMQHFAGGNYGKAAEWFIRFSQAPDVTPIEKYECLTYAARALRELRKFDDALQVDLLAIEAYPDWADGYIGLAGDYVGLGIWDKALFWGEQVKSKVPPERLIFINPLDYTFNVNLTLSVAYTALHEFDKALEQLKMALAVRPNDATVLAQLRQIEEAKFRQQVVEGVKSFYTALIREGDWAKAVNLHQNLPEWMRWTPATVNLHKQIVDRPIPQLPPLEPDKEFQAWVKKEGGGVVISNLGVVGSPRLTLQEAESKADLVLITIGNDEPNRIRHFEEPTLEHLLTQDQGREILTLHEMPNKRLIASFKKGTPKEKVFRFFAGASPEVWEPFSAAERGVGGSEMAAWQTCKNMQEKGYQSFLYGMADGVYDGVIYRKYEKFQPTYSNIFVSSRAPQVFQTPFAADRKLLWFHDIDCWTMFKPEYAELIDFLVVLSKWHAGHIRRAYPWLKDCEVIDLDNNLCLDLDEEAYPGRVFYPNAKLDNLPKIAIIGDGINPLLFEKRSVRKVEHRFIWMSSPDRGLLELLLHWKRIKKELPKATLHIFYGWQYFDAGRPGDPLKPAILKLLNQPGVYWRGRVGQVELVNELWKSDIWFYPLHEGGRGFRETFCISAAEAQAAGALCVCRSSGALGETVADRGVLIPPDAGDRELDYLFSLVYDKNRQDELRQKGQEWARKQTWTHVVDRLLKICEKEEKK